MNTSQNTLVINADKLSKAVSGNDPVSWTGSNNPVRYRLAVRQVSPTHREVFLEGGFEERGLSAKGVVVEVRITWEQLPYALYEMPNDIPSTPSLVNKGISL